MEKYQISVNDSFELNISPDEHSLDFVKEQNGQFHILYKNKAYKAELLEQDANGKTFLIKINNNKYTIAVKDKYDQLVKKLGLSNLSSSKMNNVKAPMPGLVLDIQVEAGQRVQKGDPLLILEAMKMENVIKATGDATIKEVIIGKGIAVDKGQLLIEME